jgi:hypothetical protein
MGQAPPGFEYPAKLREYGVPHGDAGSETAPNGTDFWWDEFLSNRWNCWYGNTGPDGTPASVSGPGDAGGLPGAPPNLLPDCAGGEQQDLSLGNGDLAKEAYLVDCSEGPDEDTGPLDCDWWTPPPKPGSAAAQQRARDVAAASQRFPATAEAQALKRRIWNLAQGGTR